MTRAGARVVLGLAAAWTVVVAVFGSTMPVDEERVGKLRALGRLEQ